MKKNNGYTLIEIIIVLGITLLFASLWLAPSLLQTDDELLGRELVLLRETLSYLQQKALATGTIQEISFAMHNNSYTYQEHQKPATHHLHRPVMYGILDGCKGSPSKESGQPAQAINFSNRKQLVATIYPDGKISCGSVYLINAKRSCMGALTTPPHQLAHIRLYRWDKSGWQHYQA